MYPLLTQGAANTGLRTIMAYPAPGHPFQGVRNFWSNPRMILPESGTPLGVEGEADNAGVLTKYRFTYAAFGDESGECTTGGGGGGGGGGQGEGEIKSPNYPAKYPHNLDEVFSSCKLLMLPQNTPLSDLEP